MESGIGSAQEAAVSPAISGRSSCPWSRCYTQARISTNQSPGIPIQHIDERRSAKAGAWQANDRGQLYVLPLI